MSQSNLIITTQRSTKKLKSSSRSRSCHGSASIYFAYPTSLRARKLLFLTASVLLPAGEGNIISSYYSSNCYEVGGGNMGPPYLKCVGCQYVEAFACLDTLRTNGSGNVPFGCGMNKLTVQPDPACCPVFEDPSRQTSVDRSTSAYPDALLCLEDAGCTGDNLHTALVAECGFNQCNEEFACTAAYSGSRTLSPALGAMALAWAVATGVAMLGFGHVG